MSRLRDLQIEWNSLVSQAQAQGLRGVREVRLYPQGLHERIPHRQARLDWLRRELGLSSSLSTPQVVEGVTGFTFGVELEFTHARLARYQVVDALIAAGIDIKAEGYNHRTASYWKVTTDGSLGSNYSINSEIVSPILSGDAGFAEVTKVCRVLLSLGCKVNKKCGLHVHIGARNESLAFFKTLARLYHKAEPVIDSFLAPSRRGYANTFCGPVRINQPALEMATNMEQIALALGQDHGLANVRSARRYRKLNVLSFWQHGTVEFRQHQGTIEAEKVCNWVRFCLRLALAARKGAALTDATMEALLSIVGATETEAHYFAGRAAFFNRAAERAAL